MSAPIDSKYSLSKRTLKLVLSGNIFASLFIFGLVYFPFNRKLSIDVVYNCSTFTKLMSCCLWSLNIIISFALRGKNDKGHDRIKVTQT